MKYESIYARQCFCLWINAFVLWLMVSGFVRRWTHHTSNCPCPCSFHSSSWNCLCFLLFFLVVLLSWKMTGESKHFCACLLCHDLNRAQPMITTKKNLGKVQRLGTQYQTHIFYWYQIICHWYVSTICHYKREAVDIDNAKGRSNVYPVDLQCFAFVQILLEGKGSLNGPLEGGVYFALQKCFWLRGLQISKQSQTPTTKNQPISHCKNCKNHHLLQLIAV